MLVGLKPYPSYKDSGVPWLRQVPSHWEVRRLRHVVDMRVSNVDKHSREGELPVRLCNYVHVYKNHRIRAGIEFMPATATKEEAEYFRLEVGDVIITKDSETWNDIAVPSLVEYSAPDLVSGYHLALLRPRNDLMLGSYLLRALQSPGISEQFHVNATGVTRFGLSHGALKDVTVTVPPTPDQDSIARYVDALDHRIGRYITAKRKLIALLNEQKQAIIHRAVTRGLDPNVRLKPSGVEWLGDVPGHWRVSKVYRVTDPLRPVMYGIVLPGPNVDNGVYIIKGGNCEPGKLREEFLSRTTFDIEASYVRSRVRRDDIVIAIRGGVGAADVVPPELEGANLTQDAARIAPSRQVYGRWLLYAVRSPMFQEQVKARVLGATIRGINIRDLKRIDLPIPSYEEQVRIASYLDQNLASINVIENRAVREISLLGELRTRLVSDVVTGKLDVREVAAGLPELEGSEPQVEAGVSGNMGSEALEDEFESTESDDALQEAVA